MEARADQLHRLAGTRPGTPPSKLAAALGLEVVEAAPLPGVRGVVDPTYPVVFIPPEPRYLERREWNIAHELLERVVPCFGPRDVHEPIIQHGVACLLLPRAAFLETVKDCGFDLPRLKSRFRHVSYHALARRVQEVLPGVSVTLWHRLEVARRHGIHTSQDASAVAAETCAVLGAYSRTGAGEASHGRIRARAWRMGTRSIPRAISLAIAA